MKKDLTKELAPIIDPKTGEIIDRNKLKDINDVIIDTTKPPEERIKSFIEQIGNPYCYLDNGIVVQISYADTTISLHDRLLSYSNNINPLKRSK